MAQIFEPYGINDLFRVKDFKGEIQILKCLQQGRRGECSASRVEPAREAGARSGSRDSERPYSRESAPGGLSRLTRRLLGHRKDCGSSAPASGASNHQGHQPHRSHAPAEREGGSIQLPRELRKEEVPPRAIRKAAPPTPGATKVLVGGVLKDAPEGFLGPRPHPRNAQPLGRRGSRQNATPTQGTTLATTQATTQATTTSAPTTPVTPEFIAKVSHGLCQNIRHRSSTVCAPRKKDLPPPEFSFQTFPQTRYQKAAAKSNEKRKQPAPLLLEAARNVLTSFVGHRASSPPTPPSPTSMTRALDSLRASVRCKDECPPIMGAFRKWKPDVPFPANITLKDAQAATKYTLPGLNVFEDTSEANKAGSFPSTKGSRRQLSSVRSRSAAVAAAAGSGEPPGALNKNQQSIKNTMDPHLPKPADHTFPTHMDKEN